MLLYCFLRCCIYGNALKSRIVKSDNDDTSLLIDDEQVSDIASAER
jgi:hypothetical protein